MTAGVHGDVTFDVPDGLVIVEPEVRELAAGIAADIRQWGHWRGPGTAKGVCIVTSPTYRRFLDRGIDAISALQGFLCGHDVYLFGALPHWNDTTPTADVLATLDGIASGLVAS